MTAYPMNLCGVSAWTKTAKTATRERRIETGKTYQMRYLSNSTWPQPFNNCTPTATNTLVSRVDIRTRMIAMIFGATNVQLGAGVDSMISSVRLSRSRQTRSPA